MEQKIHVVLIGMLLVSLTSLETSQEFIREVIVWLLRLHNEKKKKEIWK